MLSRSYSQFYEMGKSGMAYGILKQRSPFLESLLLVFGVVFLSSQNLRLKLPLKKEAY